MTRAFARRAALIDGSVIDNSIGELQRAGRGTISLAMGSPPPAALPRNVLRDAAHHVLADPDATGLGYAPTEGDQSLREALLKHLESRGACPEPSELLITAGGMQGIDLVCKLFIEPGDLAIVESPTYTNGTATIASYEGSVLEIPVDGEGMDVERIPAIVKAAKRTPKLFYVIPNFQNPTGETLSVARRRRLLDLADEYGALILEDDPYGWLSFDGTDSPSIWSMAGERRNVIAVHTFSKILAPGLRVGWLMAPSPVAQRLVAAKQGVDTCTNVICQRLVARFLEAGLMDVHLERVRPSYRERKEVMQEALTEEFGSIAGCTWNDPSGGLFLWLTLPDEVAGSELADQALADGVAVIPGIAFSPTGLHSSALRLCFSYQGLPEIREGIARLRRAFDTVLARPRSNSAVGAASRPVRRVVA